MLFSENDQFFILKQKRLKIFRKKYYLTLFSHEFRTNEF